MLTVFRNEGYALLRFLNSVGAVWKSISKAEPQDIFIRLYNIVVGRRIVSNLWLKKRKNPASNILVALVSYLAVLLVKSINKEDDKKCSTKK